MSEHKKKAGRPVGTTTGQSFKSVVREISDETQLKPDIVEAILRCYSDLFTRNVLLYGKFYWPNCFNVHTKTKKEYKAYNVHTGKYEIQPEMEILQMSISKKIRNLWKWKQTNERNARRGVTRDNWRSYYDKDKEE